MKKIKSIIIVGATLLSHESISQVTQVEFTSGFYKSGLTYFSIKQLDKKREFSFSTLTFFQKFHRKEEFFLDETGVQGTMYWNFRNNMSIGPTVYFNSYAGFSEKLSFLFFKGGQKIVFIAIPAVSHSEKTKNLGGEIFLQFQFSQPIKNKWNFLAYTQMITNWSKFSNHDRSFQQIRAGLSKNNYQFGIAADFDQYGKIPITKTTLGIFVRKIFVDK